MQDTNWERVRPRKPIPTQLVYERIKGSEVYENVRAVVDKDGVSLYSEVGSLLTQKAHFEIIGGGELLRERDDVHVQRPGQARDRADDLWRLLNRRHG